MAQPASSTNLRASSFGPEGSGRVSPPAVVKRAATSKPLTEQNRPLPPTRVPAVSSINTATSRPYFPVLIIQLAILLAIGFLLSFNPYVVPILSLVPANTLRQHFYIWNILTSTFFEFSFVNTITHIAVVLFLGRSFVGMWGGKELLRFVVIVGAATASVVTLGTLCLDFFFFTSLAAATYSSFLGVMSALFVAMKHAAGDRDVIIVVTSFKARMLPFVVLCVGCFYDLFMRRTLVVTNPDPHCKEDCVLVVSGPNVIPLTAGIVCGWFYLRFLQPHERVIRNACQVASESRYSDQWWSTGIFEFLLAAIGMDRVDAVHVAQCTVAGACGDPSDHATFASLFPDPLASTASRLGRYITMAAVQLPWVGTWVNSVWSRAHEHHEGDEAASPGTPYTRDPASPPFLGPLGAGIRARDGRGMAFDHQESEAPWFPGAQSASALAKSSRPVSPASVSAVGDFPV